MARNKKNELDMLLGAIKKSLNNKASLDDKDIETAMEVLEINKLKKELTETLETMCNFKYTDKKQTKETLETLKNFLQEDFKTLKETEETEIAKIKKASKKKATAKKENEEVEIEEKVEEKVENISEAQETQNN